MPNKPYSQKRTGASDPFTHFRSFQGKESGTQLQYIKYGRCCLVLCQARSTTSIANSLTSPDSMYPGSLACLIFSGIFLAFRPWKKIGLKVSEWACAVLVCLST